MAWPIRKLLSGALPLLVRPPREAAEGPAAPPLRRRQRRAGAVARRLQALARAEAAVARGLQELARAEAAVAAAVAREAAGPPARLLRSEALHGAAEAHADRASLLGGGSCEAPESPRRRASGESSESRADSPRRRASERKRRQKELTDADAQVEEAWKAEAKDSILEANSISEMFWAAEEHIDDDWLGGVDELPGNIYRIAALGTLTSQFSEKDADPTDTFRRLVRVVGCITIFLIQLCGPPLLIASVYFDWGIIRDNDIHWRDWEPSFSDWQAIKTTKVLSTLFLFVFSINGLYVILQEKQSWAKIYKTFRYLKHNTPNMDVRGEPFLILGPIVNSWVVLLTSIASFTILGASFSPRNVLFDALGLLFLYNLDDINSDLGFVSADDWDGLRLGWIYQEMVVPNYSPSVSSDEQPAYNAEDIGPTGRSVLRLYDVVSMLLLACALVMPAVALITPFLAIVPVGFE